MNTTKGIPGKRAPVWPKINSDVKRRVIKHFNKCIKAGRPILKIEETESEYYVKYSILFRSECPENETCFLDNEFIQVRVYEFVDVPGRKMQITIGNRDNQAGRSFFAYNEETYLADAADISWLERLVSRK